MSNIWNGDLKSLPEKGSLFEFDGILYIVADCPCSCGRTWAREYFSGKDNPALSYLMRPDVGNESVQTLVETCKEIAETHYSPIHTSLELTYHLLTQSLNCLEN